MWGDSASENRTRRVGGAHVVVGEPAGLALEVRIVRRQVGTDRLPALPAVGGDVDALAAGVHPVRVMGRDVDGEGPLEPVAQLAGRPPFGVVGPDAHVPRLPGAVLVALEDALVTARPDDPRIVRVRDREPGFAAAHRRPGADRDPAAGEAVGRTAGGGAILPVPHDPIGDPVVRVDVIHLGDRQARPLPGLAPVRGDAHPAVVAHDHPVGPVGGYPHVVVVAAGVVQEGGEPAVGGGRVPRREEVRLVGVVGGRHHPACSSAAAASGCGPGSRVPR